MEIILCLVFALGLRVKYVTLLYVVFNDKVMVTFSFTNAWFTERAGTQGGNHIERGGGEERNADVDKDANKGR